MNWYKIARKKEFDYEGETKHLWSQLISHEMDRVDIHFNTENDEIIGTRMLDCDVKISEEDDRSYRVLCEMRVAGGDWECPNIYFRCQMQKKYDKQSRWSSEYKFIFIPSKNLNLEKREQGGFVARHNDAENCLSFSDVTQKDFWEKARREAENRKKLEWKMYEKSQNNDDDVWGVGFARDLLKHWKPQDR